MLEFRISIRNALGHEPCTIGWWFHRLFGSGIAFRIWTYLNCVWPRWQYGKYGISKPIFDYLEGRSWQIYWRDPDYRRNIDDAISGNEENMRRLLC
jgi:hypothetical protein